MNSSFSPAQAVALYILCATLTSHQLGGSHGFVSPRRRDNMKRNCDYVLPVEVVWHQDRVEVIWRQDRSARSSAAARSSVEEGSVQLQRIISHKPVNISSSITGALRSTISCVDVTEAWYINRKASPLLFKLIQH